MDGRKLAPAPTWTLVTSHGLVLFYVASHPDATIREIAGELDFTERRIAAIIRDLSAAELVTVNRQGRKNYYVLARSARFMHPVLSDVPFSAFVSLWRKSKSRAERRETPQKGLDGAHG